MEKNSIKLKWCKVRLGEDLNWWVTETSDKVNWDADGLSVIDPNQSAHIVETLSGLKEYGLLENVAEKAFFACAIDGKPEKNNTIKISKVNGSVFDEDECYFWLPNNLDDERSPYAEFLDHITSLQVKMLNDTFRFEEKLTIEDLEEEVREKYHADYMEGKAIHVFTEIMDILEYVPQGYSLEEDEEDGFKKKEKEDSYDDIDDLPSEEENIEEDDTMQWGDEEDGEESENPDDDRFSDFSDDEDE